MGNIYEDVIRDSSKALDFYHKALNIYEKTKGLNCFESVDTLIYMGSIYQNKGDNLKAIDFYERSIKIYEMNFKNSGVKSSMC